MPGNGPNMSFTPYERPVRAAFVGLGRIYDLNVRAYVDNPDVEVVALVDPSEERRAQRQADWPAARTFASAAELAASGLEVDAVEVLLPIALHADGVAELLGYGWHVNLQKPMCNDLADATAHARRGRGQRPAPARDGQLRLLRAADEAQGDRPTQARSARSSGYHMKMVGSGRGGWDVPGSSYEWQFQQMRRGRGILVFDDGWHKLTTAIWLFGPIEEVRAWVGTTEVVPGIEVDAPATIVWEHHNGIRGVWDITLAIDMYLRSDYYTNDERWEITGRTRLRAGQPVHRPRYPAAEPGGLRRRRDALLPRARRRLGQQLPGLGPPLAALAAHRRGPDAVERRRGRRRPAFRPRRVCEQRSRWHRRGPGFARLAGPSPCGKSGNVACSPMIDRLPQAFSGRPPDDGDNQGMDSLLELLTNAAAKAADYREKAAEQPVFPGDADLEAVRTALGSLADGPPPPTW